MLKFNIFLKEFLSSSNLSLSNIFCVGLNRDNKNPEYINGLNVVNKLCKNINKPCFLICYEHSINNVKFNDDIS